MFCRSGFFFTNNTSVLNIISKTAGLRLSLARPGTASTPLTKLLLNLRFTRRYSSVSGAISPSAAMGLKNVTSKAVKNTYPVVSSKAAGYWLVCTSGLIFGIVVVGGLTRLTESGLSITEWKPVTGAIPPLNEAKWISEFEKYKDSPEFKQLTSHITLDEFKFIFSMEWGHRFLGRCIGVFLILPALYFWKMGRFSSVVSKRVVGFTGLLGLQGVIGWWMVKSGLDEEQLAERKSKPTVSQYRLTTHLGAAFLMYLGVLWTAYEILNENRWVKGMKKDPKKVMQALAALNSTALNKTRTIALGLLVLTFFTAMSGGMVAGLDAGLIYNTFPHMGDDYFPCANELMSPAFARKDDKSDLLWRNLLENPTTVQLVHRILATSTFFAVLAGQMYVNRNKAIIPARAQRTLHTVMGLAALQVSLGISTLIYLVPIPLAAAHQAGALALLTGCLAFAANVKRPRPQTMNYIGAMMKKQLLKSQH